MLGKHHFNPLLLGAATAFETLSLVHLAESTASSLSCEAYLLGFVDALHTTRWSSRNSEPALVALDLTSSVCAQVQMHRYRCICRPSQGLKTGLTSFEVSGVRIDQWCRCGGGGQCFGTRIHSGAELQTSCCRTRCTTAYAAMRGLFYGLR